MREPLCRAAEDLIKPLDTLLVRYIDQAVVAKDIRQAVRAGVLLLKPPFTGHPEVAPPRRERQTKKDHAEGCQRRACHTLASDSCESGSLASNGSSLCRSVPRLQGAQSKYRCSVPLRRMSSVTQWNPPPNILECRSLSGIHTTTPRQLASRII